MSERSLARVLGAPVRVGTVRVGEVCGVFVDTRRERILGLEVSGAGGARRFLPWIAATLEDGDVRAPSALHLVDEAPSYERLGAVRLQAVHLESLFASADGSLAANGHAVFADASAGINGR